MAIVDPTTGLPKEVIEGKRQMELALKLEAQKGKSQELSNDIGSEQGQFILSKIKEHFLSRVNELISNDERCMAYKKLLIDMGVQINMGEFAVERLMKLVEKLTP